MSQSFSRLTGKNACWETRQASKSPPIFVSGIAMRQYPFLACLNFKPQIHRASSVALHSFEGGLRPGVEAPCDGVRDALQVLQALALAALLHMLY